MILTDNNKPGTTPCALTYFGHCIANLSQSILFKTFNNIVTFRKLDRNSNTSVFIFTSIFLSLRSKDFWVWLTATGYWKLMPRQGHGECSDSEWFGKNKNTVWSSSIKNDKDSSSKINPIPVRVQVCFDLNIIVITTRPGVQHCQAQGLVLCGERKTDRPGFLWTD